MIESAWNCAHCGSADFLASALDKGIGICHGCGFTFVRGQEPPGDSTWREQAQVWNASPLADLIQTDRYDIIRALASGAQGRIVLAHHKPLDQICVLKIIEAHDEWRELAAARLQAEARAGVMVSHPNVARVIDFDCAGDTWYFAMEYVPGENLRRIIHAVERLCWRQVVEIGVQIADGLAAIHNARMIHRDVKPSNLMLRTDGTPKITDLGLVKMHHTDQDMTLTQDGQVLGTPYYMAPEQFTGTGDLSPGADIYALGATFYHLLTGKPPYQGSGIPQLAKRHRHDPVIWPDDAAQRVPSWLRHLVEHCLAKRPEHRIASAEELRDALKAGTDLRPTLRATADAAPRGVVVFGLDNLSRREEDDWIGDAVADYLANRLMATEGVNVVDRSQFAQVLARQGPAPTASAENQELAERARLLGVGTLVLGAFQRAGERLRLTAHTVSLQPGGKQITAEASGSFEDLFALEDHLAATLIGGLQPASVAGVRDAPRRVENIVAEEHVARGRRAFANGDYAEAIELAETALAAQADHVGAASLIGASCARIGDYDRALDYHQRAERIARRLHDNRGLAEALGNIGVMYYYKGDYQLALEFLEQARDLCAQLEQLSDIAKYDGNLGFALMRLNRHGEAEDSFERAIAVHKTLGDLVSLAWPYNGMGSVLVKQRRYAEASEYYRRALTLATETDDRVNIGVSQMNLGRCAYLMDHIAEAEANFDEALDALNGTDFWNGLTLVYEYMADMYLHEGNTDAALAAIDHRLALAEKHHNQRMAADAWEQRARAFELAGEQQRALRCLKKSIELTQQPQPHESLHRHLRQQGEKTAP